MTAKEFLHELDLILRDLDAIANFAEHAPLAQAIAERVKNRIRRLYGWALNQARPSTRRPWRDGQRRFEVGANAALAYGSAGTGAVPDARKNA